MGYQIQGWQKGVNSAMVEPTKDMGRDGDFTLGSNINVNFARDVFGYSLGYFEGDYYSINNVSAGGNHFLANISGSDLLAARNDLYNGNISHMVTSITQPGTTTVLPYGYAYQYDQLNRLVHMEGYNNLDFPSNSWKTGGYTGAYETSITYDANGNILTLNRNGEAGNTKMDNLSYQYDWVNNDPAQGLRSNKLYHVNDATISTYTSDIDDQGGFTPASSVNDINALNNYGYDELGNLIRDDAEGIASIEWTVYGKIKSITRSASSTASNLSFKYDAQGKRIEKRETPYGGGADKVTYYVYDAGGNLMATYSRHLRDDANDSYDGEEMFVCNSHVIYGSSRIGVDGRQDTLVGHLIAPIPTGYHTRLLGSKQYENSNHLGNVLVTISDIKIPHDYNANSVVDYYTADIINAQDYYPFGSIMPGRNWSNEEYRFGFNGMEKDNERYGDGNAYTTEFRQYDARLGRWFSLDPISVAWESNYVINRNNPLINIDPKGDNPITAAVISAFAEYASIVGSKMLFDGLTFGEANAALTWEDGVDIAIAAGFGAATGAIDGGITKFTSWISNPTNRNIFVLLLETGVSALEGSLKSIYKEEFDLELILYGALAEVGMGNLLKSDIIKEAGEKASKYADDATKRAEELATRRQPNEKLIKKAQEDAAAAQKQAKEFNKLNNAGNTARVTAAKTTSATVQRVVAQKKEPEKSQPTTDGFRDRVLRTDNTQNRNVSFFRTGG